MAAPLLAAWADAAGLSRAAAPPGAFANGFLFGELLAAHGLQPDFAIGGGAFRDAARVDSTLRNYCALAGSLRGLGVELSAQTAVRIARGDDAAASQLLLAIHGAVTARPQLTGGGGVDGASLAAPQATLTALTRAPGSVTTDSTAAAPVALQAHRPRRASYEAASAAVFERTLRGLLGDQRALNYATIQARHDAGAAAVAATAAAVARAEEDAARHEVAARRHRMRAQRAADREAAARRDAASTTAWVATMRVRREAVTADARLAAAAARRRSLGAAEASADAAGTLRAGLEWWEARSSRVLPPPAAPPAKNERDQATWDSSDDDIDSHCGDVSSCEPPNPTTTKTTAKWGAAADERAATTRRQSAAASVGVSLDDGARDGVRARRRHELLAAADGELHSALLTGAGHDGSGTCSVPAAPPTAADTALNVGVQRAWDAARYALFHAAVAEADRERERREADAAELAAQQAAYAALCAGRDAAVECGLQRYRKATAAAAAAARSYGEAAATAAVQAAMDASAAVLAFRQSVRGHSGPSKPREEAAAAGDAPDESTTLLLSPYDGRGVGDGCAPTLSEWAALAGVSLPALDAAVATVSDRAQAASAACQLGLPSIVPALFAPPAEEAAAAGGGGKAAGSKTKPAGSAAAATPTGATEPVPQCGGMPSSARDSAVAAALARAAASLPPQHATAASWTVQFALGTPPAAAAGVLAAVVGGDIDAAAATVPLPGRGPLVLSLLGPPHTGEARFAHRLAADLRLTLVDVPPATGTDGGASRATQLARTLLQLPKCYGGSTSSEPTDDGVDGGASASGTRGVLLVDFPSSADEAAQLETAWEAAQAESGARGRCPLALALAAVCVDATAPALLRHALDWHCEGGGGATPLWHTDHAPPPPTSRTISLLQRVVPDASDDAGGCADLAYLAAPHSGAATSAPSADAYTGLAAGIGAAAADFHYRLPALAARYGSSFHSHHALQHPADETAAYAALLDDCYAAVAAAADAQERALAGACEAHAASTLRRAAAADKAAYAQRVRSGEGAAARAVVAAATATEGGGGSPTVVDGRGTVLEEAPSADLLFHATGSDAASLLLLPPPLPAPSTAALSAAWLQATNAHTASTAAARAGLAEAERDLVSALATAGGETRRLLQSPPAEFCAELQRHNDAVRGLATAIAASPDDADVAAEVALAALETRYRLRDLTSARAKAVGAEVSAAFERTAAPAVAAAASRTCKELARLMVAERDRFLAARRALLQHYAEAAGCTRGGDALLAASGLAADTAASGATPAAASKGDGKPRGAAAGATAVGDGVDDAALAEALAVPVVVDVAVSTTAAVTSVAPAACPAPAEGAAASGVKSAGGGKPAASKSTKPAAQPASQQHSPPPPSTAAPCAAAAATSISEGILPATYLACTATANVVTAQVEAMAMRQARARTARVAAETAALQVAVAAVRADEKKAAAALAADAAKAAKAVAAAAAASKGKQAAVAVTTAPTDGAAAATMAPPPPPRRVEDIVAATALPPPTPDAAAARLAVDESQFVVLRYETAAYRARLAQLLVAAGALVARWGSLAAVASASTAAAVEASTANLYACADALTALRAAPQGAAGDWAASAPLLLFADVELVPCMPGSEGTSLACTGLAGFTLRLRSEEAAVEGCGGEAAQAGESCTRAD